MGVLVAVLSIATVVLVVLALQSVRPTNVDGGASPQPTYSFGSDPTPSASTTTSPAPTASTAPTTTPSAAPGASYPGAETRYLSIGSNGWWRATAGECGGAAPLVEHSTDAGRTWEDVTPYYRGLAEVASLDAFAGSEAEMVAAVGGACEVQALRTFTQGEFWQPYPEVLAASRYLDPADPASAVVRGTRMAAPCAEPASFRAAGDVVAVDCDGAVSVLGSSNAWQPLPATGAVALAATGETVLTAAPAEGCAGVAVTRWSGEGFATTTPLGCAADVDPAAPLAVAALDDGAVVWSGDRVIPVG
ncbi:hypothetical protein ACFXQA_14715 [Microbacterium sp. P07]|uniref:hypothetical protein n=1 Tax=Microbacterium sp. P07 TaxID=3366952 RepID=UPI003746040F